jgi:hypothetical protein
VCVCVCVCVEQVLLKSRYSEKADVFSFAIVLNELYTGQMPYQTEPYNKMNQIGLSLAISQGARPDHGSMPAPLLQLVSDCWVHDARVRPSFPEIVLRLRRLGEMNLPDGHIGVSYMPARRLGDSVTDDDYESASNDDDHDDDQAGGDDGQDAIHIAFETTRADDMVVLEMPSSARRNSGSDSHSDTDDEIYSFNPDSDDEDSSDGSTRVSPATTNTTHTSTSTSSGYDTTDTITVRRFGTDNELATLIDS